MLQAINVRTEHVHLVISASARPERVLTILKSRCTRELRIHGLVGPDERPWSRHGSTRYLWDEAQVEAACHYVRDLQ